MSYRYSLLFEGIAIVIGVTYDEVDVPGWVLWLILGWAIARLLIDVVLTAYRYLSNYCTSGNVQTMNEFFVYLHENT